MWRDGISEDQKDRKVRWRGGKRGLVRRSEGPKVRRGGGEVVGKEGGQKIRRIGRSEGQKVKFSVMWFALRMHDIPSLYPNAMLHAVPGAQLQWTGPRLAYCRG